MRILTAQQHQELDQATLEQDGISSLELMERAATAWAKRFTELFADKSREVVVVCGPGNNGGDGLAIARLLRFEAYTISVVAADIAPASPDHQDNRRRAKDVGVHIRTLREGDALPSFRKRSIVIDALFGTGLSRSIEGYWAWLVEHLNEQPVTRVAVDLPSGLRTDEPSTGAIVRADRTLSLGYPKLALFAPANTEYLGHWELVPFRLADPPAPADGASPPPRMLTPRPVAALLKARRANDHKGTFGHALLVAGGFGKMGAAVLSARSVLRAGAGLLTVHIPRVGYEILQMSIPEAMCSIDQHRYMVSALQEDVTQYDTVGVGPGLGTKPATQQAVFQLLEQFPRPLVIDADALNILAGTPEKLATLPAGSLLTPHPKEFERLFGATDDDFQRWQLQLAKARELNAVIVLKTGYTAVATPDGELFFNTTGNPGMGTGGTGDALTGILTGLLAQGYPPADAARLGVYLHGLAGDLAARDVGQESLLAEDLIHHLGPAFKKLHRLAERHQ
ncbi:NAD(P)H-hydrate epimerase [Lewinella marina]|uniref:Bifunctional NAD(P)H-hydrate repair enzyme n=1 Tax=Neolewinella marina TaxID=438751 RepID=A0A2G0CIH7_9BACT|nr:NAD(P)H-hydrate dehydratase [Neolewinella marina]NJB85138.1 NAD(P)H-hydrate epimerase [Neolewinella marina]PHK99727.1 bifunctional ADP-dependent NAD(P)H-hydrate dehydratase/NAD(P)H-hydrate epimerase [Neolewinella marina]